MELLSPAGNFTKLKTALLYGADAVYLGGRNASLRSNAEFSLEELNSAIDYVHYKGKKAYVTANIFPHNKDLGFLKEYIMQTTSADGYIVSDLGVFDLCQKCAPNVPIHISTQANNTNYQAGIKWHEIGAKRIILARELTIEEIREYRENTPETLELEVFIHGAMCMGYSGRCLISNYLTNRNANDGSCAQPCRWEYNLVNRGDSLEINENERGTFFLNSFDMCLIEHIDELKKLGINSVKIEGRNKSEYYVAAVTKAYRNAIDGGTIKIEELEKVSHRPYVYNFGELTQNYGTSNYIRSAEVMGIVENYIDGYLLCSQRGKIIAGDSLEVLTPVGENILIENAEIFDPETLVPFPATPHAEMPFLLKTPCHAPSNSFIRK